MKKNRKKNMAILLSLILSETTTLTANAQTWVGNGYSFKRDSNDTKSLKELDEVEFDFETILGNITYKDLCCFFLDNGIDETDVWFPIAIYISADRAIKQESPLNYEKFYLSMADAKIKNAYYLVEGEPQLIGDINMLYDIDKDNLSFALVKNDSNSNDEIVGYINGKDMIAMALPSMTKYKKQKILVK